MAKVTSKLQVTVPKAVADRYSIRPGDEIEWEAAGEAIRVLPRFGRKPDVRARLRSFDQATARISQRGGAASRSAGRGWTREELYRRGRAR